MLDWRLASLLAALCFAGCRPQEQIARYTVPKPDLVNPVSNAAAPTAAPVEQAMLGAILPVGEQSWFFKLTGEPKVVEPQREAFLAFVKSVKFASGGESKPSWTLPDGWTELPGSEFRFATIRLAENASDGKPLEIAVSSAGGTVLDNVNRWRGQVGLKRIDGEELARTTETFKAGDKEATFVRLVGTTSGSMGGGPFAPFAGRAAVPPLGKGADGGNAPDKPVVYDAPKEWTAGALNQFRKASFTVVDGELKAEITVIDLEPGSGDLLSNVNRWRNQVGLPPVAAADLVSSATKIDAFGVQGDYVELIGPGDVAQSQTILGVMAAAGGRAWFVKLLGDSELAAREKPRFEAFVKSLRLK